MVRFMSSLILIMLMMMGGFLLMDCMLLCFWVIGMCRLVLLLDRVVMLFGVLLRIVGVSVVFLVILWFIMIGFELILSFMVSGVIVIVGVSGLMVRFWMMLILMMSVLWNFVSFILIGCLIFVGLIMRLRLWSFVVFGDLLRLLVLSVFLMCFLMRCLLIILMGVNLEVLSSEWDDVD